MNQKGIKKITKEFLSESPLNVRILNSVEIWKENRPVKSVGFYKSYVSGRGKNTRIIDLVGPLEHVPEFFCAKTDEERRKIERDRDRRQLQLSIPESGGIFIREMVRSGYCYPRYMAHGSHYTRAEDLDIILDMGVRHLINYPSDDLLRDEGIKAIYSCDYCRNRLINSFKRVGLREYKNEE